MEPQPATDAEVLGQLREAFEHFQRPFPRAAVALAEAHRAIVAPWLVQVLEDVARNPDAAAADNDYMLHQFATALLGHWRDTRAYRPLLALLRLPFETVDALFGDTLFETYERAVASVCDGDMAPLAQIIDDDTVSIWVRIALIGAWTLRVIEGDAPAGPLEDCLLAIGERNAAQLRRGEVAQTDPQVVTAVANAACDFASERLRGPCLSWFAEELIDTKHIDRAWFEKEMAIPRERQRQLVRERGKSYLRDPEAEIGWWDAYRDQPQRPSQRVFHAESTIVRKAPKIGRNDPCPCGSGRKYKKCHGAS